MSQYVFFFILKKYFLNFYCKKICCHMSGL